METINDILIRARQAGYDVPCPWDCDEDGQVTEFKHYHLHGFAHRPCPMGHARVERIDLEVSTTETHKPYNVVRLVS